MRKVRNMRKGKTLLGIMLSLVLLLGGALLNMGTVYADGPETPQTGYTIALKVMEDGADVTIQRVDDTDVTLYRAMTKENLPKNAVIRLTLPEDDADSYKVKSVELGSTSYTLESLPEELEVRDGSIVKVVYEATHSDFDSFDVTYYDYDYSNPTGGGINDERNYPAGSLETQRLQMGVADNYHDGLKTEAGYQYGSDLGATNYNVDMLLTRPDGVTAVGQANWNNGVDVGGGNVGIDGVFWPIVSGLVTGLDTAGNPIYGTNKDGQQIYDPGFFTNEEKLGKHIYTQSNLNGSSLDYERDGYHYVLKRANVNGDYTYVKQTSGSSEVSNPRFFPLDNLTDDSQKFVDPWHGTTEDIEDYLAHNWYFGIRQEFTFTVGDYDGPLEYTFEGDDDLWVFLDDKLVLDLGGMHSAYPSAYQANVGRPEAEWSWPNTVDLKSIIQNDANWREKEYKVTILYLERGGYDSNCYMDFVLPIKAAPELEAVIDIPAETVFVGQDAAVADGNFNPETDVVKVYLIDKSTINSEHPTIIAEKTTSAALGWRVDFSDVDLDAGIEYAVIGEKLPDFEKPVITGSISEGYTLTYKYSPETRTLNIRKVWDASVTAAGKSASSVKVKVLADGVQYGEILTIGEADGWSKTVENLPVRKNKTVIAYTVEEVDIPDGMISDISGSADTGYVITNKMSDVKKYHVSYTFKSGTEGKKLPKEVLALMPSSTTATEGSTVTAVKPAQTKVKVSDGVWTFVSYDKTKKVVDADVTFTGTWVYTADTKDSEKDSEKDSGKDNGNNSGNSNDSGDSGISGTNSTGEDGSTGSSIAAKAVKTGDGSKPALWITLLLLSAMALSGLGMKSKKDAADGKRK